MFSDERSCRWPRAGGHQVSAPGRAELDPFDPAAVGASMGGVDAVLHLATRIQPLEKMGQPEAWRETTGCAPGPRPSWSTRHWPPRSRRISGRPSRSSTRKASRPRRRRTYARTSRSSSAPRWPPRSRPPGSPRPGGTAWCCASGCSTARAPATTGRTRPWAPRCTPRTPPARRPRAARRAHRPERHLQRLPPRGAGQPPPVHRSQGVASTALDQCLARLGVCGRVPQQAPEVLDVGPFGILGPDRDPHRPHAVQ